MSSAVACRGISSPANVKRTVTGVVSKRGPRMSGEGTAGTVVWRVRRIPTAPIADAEARASTTTSVRARSSATYAPDPGSRCADARIAAFNSAPTRTAIPET